MPLRVGPSRNLQLVSRQRAFRSAGPLPSKPYQYRRQVLGQDRRAPCTRDLILGIRGQRRPSRGGCSDADESDGVRESDRHRSRRRAEGAVYPGGAGRSELDRAAISGTEVSSDGGLQSNGGRGWIRVRGGKRKVGRG